MTRPARILVIGDSAKQDTRLADQLRSFGFDSAAIAMDSRQEISAPDHEADILILKMTQPQTRDNAGRFIQVAKELKALNRHHPAPVILVGEQTEDHRQSACMAAETGDVDDVILGQTGEEQICGRINSLMRLSTMRDELNRRLATTSEYGVDAPYYVAPPKQIRNASILIVGPSIYYSEIERTLPRDASLTGALSYSIAMDYLQNQSFDTVLVDVADDPQAAMDFTRTMRQNSRLYNLPVVFFASENQTQELDEAYSNGVTDILFAPFSQAQINARMMSLVREQRFRDAMKQIYAKARHLATSDALTGLYSRGFLLSHMQAVIRDSVKYGHALTVIALNLGNIRDINTEYGYITGDRILRQVGEAIGLLTRGEDLAARYSGSGFVVLLPDTPVEAANVAMRRIRAIINCTDFSIKELSEPVNVYLECGMAELGVDDTPESLIKRAKTSCA